MKILIVGGGGREHALAWKLSKSPRVRQIYCAPGNAGIADLAECVPIKAAKTDKLLEFALENAVDLTVVGPEDPLSMGIADLFEKNGLKIFGASKAAARIESSKFFAKSLMNKYGIPAAKGEAFTSYDKAKAYIRKMGAPIVVKADGLAAGKGVMVCAEIQEALDALDLIMKDNAFGEAGSRVVIEERLEGEEASFLAFVDGETVLPLPSSQDHKPVFDGDKGPNTGGMGAYSPAPVAADPYMEKKIMETVMIPAVRGMAAEGCPYKGVLYAGLMIKDADIKVLEFNARFGDPEAQPLLARVKNDMVPVMEAVIEGRLDECRLDIDERAAVCVVMASGGYPGDYEKGAPISGLEAAGRMRNVSVFHSGTEFQNGAVAASGGRVLGVTALGDSVEKAIEKAYGAVSKIRWENVHYRKDIGAKAVARLNAPPRVGIVMGSDSDLGVMESAAAVLKEFGVRFEMTVASAHRSPERAQAFAAGAVDRGMKAIIAGAGHAAHLAGAMAAHSTLPVIGVPIDSSCLNGLDSLLSTVQMPPGMPVATMAVGKSGARNAGILAVQILALSDPALSEKLVAFKRKMSEKVDEKAEKLKVWG
ncbi:Phosphoribosylamine--glycine ligase / N5-carboxyaminoimidazole ribonucleotide mutase [Candidatus Desulfarcum epimagneticum]|uniref:Multifunctional fusion protein n=1 Tax=uncultured Desulfobacteraceae bacterium TaxID=218296 RepID=A0A484HE73_9BACT|nr:Phosphoribosylamine--glycine ligase / N5-carboxyaminoimidazole ribonucleotide mutase [uncultured Desulfobacteraceae bacterium]